TPKQIEPVLGYGLAGAAVAGDALVLAATRDEIESGEASVPDLATEALILTGLAPRALYEVQTTSASAPGSPAFRTSAEASAAGLIHVRWKERDGRLRVRRLRR
ncbi:MAG TPA: hypothetical protein VIZ31_06485, partial [Vicinamibacteria bacterium]